MTTIHILTAGVLAVCAWSGSDDGRWGWCDSKPPYEIPFVPDRVRTFYRDSRGVSWADHCWSGFQRIRTGPNRSTLTVSSQSMRGC